MPSMTPAQGVAWLKAHPTRAYVPGAVQRAGVGWSWTQLCVAAMYWAVGATHSYDTADDARVASKLVAGSSKVRTGLPDGVFVWFSLGTDGHVAFVYQGRLYMASKFVTSLFPGAMALGSCASVAEYEHASDGKYLGYSWDFGGQTFAGTTSTAGTGTVTPLQEEIDMSAFDFAFDTAQGVWIITPDGADSLTAFEWACFQKLRAANQPGADMTSAANRLAANELSTISNKVRALAKGNAGAAATPNLQPVLDSIASLAAALGADVTTINTAVAKIPTTTLTSAQLTAELTQLLADLKAAIPALPKSGTITFP